MPKLDYCVCGHLNAFHFEEQKVCSECAECTDYRPEAEDG